MDIYIAKIKGFGYVTGGASSFDKQKNADDRLYRGLVELARHLQGFDRYAKSPNHFTLNTQYEQRLIFFASGQGNDLVEKRLSTRGHKAIGLSELATDAIIPHRFDQKVVVYRCTFSNPPEFLGGSIARLCL